MLGKHQEKWCFPTALCSCHVIPLHLRYYPRIPHPIECKRIAHDRRYCVFKAHLPARRHVVLAIEVNRLHDRRQEFPTCTLQSAFLQSIVFNPLSPLSLMLLHPLCARGLGWVWPSSPEAEIGAQTRPNLLPSHDISIGDIERSLRHGFGV